MKRIFDVFIVFAFYLITKVPFINAEDENSDANLHSEKKELESALDKTFESISEFHTYMVANQHKMTVIFYYVPGNEASLNVFRKVATDPVFSNLDYKFIIITDCCKDIFAMTPGSVHFHFYFDGSGTAYRKELEYESLKLLALAMQYSMYSNKENSQEIFTNKPAIMLFRKPDDNNRADAELSLKKARYLLGQKDPQIEQKLSFLICGYVEEHDYNIADFARLKDGELKIIIVDTRSTDDDKWMAYHLKEDLTEESIISFVDDFFNDKLKFTIISDYLPSEEENQGPLKKIVGDNFRKEVMESKGDFFLYLSSMYCNTCDLFKPYFRKLQHLVLKTNPHITFGEMDNLKNMVKEIEPKHLPYFYYFKDGNKDTPIHYSGSFGSDELLEWIKTQSTVPIVVNPEKQEDNVFMDPNYKFVNSRRESSVDHSLELDKEKLETSEKKNKKDEI